jgi:hypothetical protein
MIPTDELRRLAFGIADAFALAASHDRAAGQSLLERELQRAVEAARDEPWESELLPLWREVEICYRERYGPRESTPDAA